MYIKLNNINRVRILRSKRINKFIIRSKDDF